MIHSFENAHINKRYLISNTAVYISYMMLVKETRCNKLYNVGFRFIKMLQLIYHIWSSTWVVHRKQEPGKNERVNVQFDCWAILFIRWTSHEYVLCIIITWDAYSWILHISITKPSISPTKHGDVTINTTDQASLYQQFPNPPCQISRVCKGRHFFLINGCGGCSLSSDLTHAPKSCDRLTEWLFLIYTQSWHITLLVHLVLVTTAHKDKHDIKELEHTKNWCQEIWFIRSPISWPCYIRSFFFCLQCFCLRYIE